MQSGMIGCPSLLWNVLVVFSSVPERILKLLRQMLHRALRTHVGQEQSPNSCHEGESPWGAYAHESVACLEIGSQDRERTRAGLLLGVNVSGLAHACVRASPEVPRGRRTCSARMRT